VASSVVEGYFRKAGKNTTDDKAGVDPSEIGRAVGATIVLRLNVRWSANDVTVRAELLDVGSRTLVEAWDETEAGVGPKADATPWGARGGLRDIVARRLGARLAEKARSRLLGTRERPVEGPEYPERSGPEKGWEKEKG
jgi:hypothetical protein